MRGVIDHLLKYKNGQEDANKLELALEKAVKRTLEDNTFRIQLGASDKYWKLFNAALLTLVQDSNEQCLINLIKLTRNVVAGNPHNQRLAIQYAALYKIEDLLAEKTSSSTDNNMILQVGTQAISNMITSNHTAIDFIWKIWMSNERRGSIWSYILSKNNDNLIMSALVLIINCIRGNKERCDLLVNRKLGKDILAAILGDIERLHGNEESKNFELGYTILSELINFGYYKKLFIEVDDYSDKDILSDHQIILLKILDSKVHGHKEAFPEFMNHEESLQFLTQQFVLIGKETLKVLISIKEQGASQLQPDQISNVYTGIALLFQIINQLFILDQEDQQIRGLKDILIKVNTLQLVIDILGHLEMLKLPTVEKERPEIGFNYIKRECVRFIGTMSYKDKDMQDKVRTLEGIPLILSQLKIDDSNPYLREYATLALRNLMENNIENQKIIEELSPQEVVQTKELSEMGITPELTQDGQVIIKKKKNLG
ncbi:spinocerebellar ataxia type 10 protein domain-containing protein [Cokeromyces recurvatus]|uniref:spinocerebellar ataxia type 10 protein domain-containing protein n=1 Tax=Cokeromyces recurvatus TaxID=90255 RepID=UPI00221F1259|nr:spinocerebellar ataxia type 10 protein domain-containing protein [Cokeromyces recurvatus]KAI7908156.1 spinocerebellar ataxia type 10 protein domain-containing protein [Cokeromyces recurvatus]